MSEALVFALEQVRLLTATNAELHRKLMVARQETEVVTRENSRLAARAAERDASLSRAIGVR